MPRWLINKNRLKKQQKKGNRRRFVIVITVSNKIEVKRLLTNGLCFGKVVKKIEKYWEAGQGLLYMRYSRINNKR